MSSAVEKVAGCWTLPLTPPRPTGFVCVLQLSHGATLTHLTIDRKPGSECSVDKHGNSNLHHNICLFFDGGLILQILWN